MQTKDIRVASCIWEFSWTQKISKERMWRRLYQNAGATACW